MKRLLVVIVFAITAGLAVWFGMRSGSPKISSTTVTALLPRETLGLFHMPDLRQARAQWHQSDIYKLWREPAMQDFLRKPLAQNPKSGVATAKLQQFDALAVRDAFVAIVAWKENRPQLAGGFRFKGSPDDVKRVLPELADRGATVEAVTHNAHRIEVSTTDAITIATVYAGDWFFAANDLPTLDAVLDRVDGRVTDSTATLRADDNFASAFKRMPRTYVAFVYARLDEYFRKLAEEMPQEDAASGQTAMLRQVRGFAAATGFDNGKMRDILYVRMPKAPDQPDLTRASLTMATAESFLYAATFMPFFHADPRGANLQTAGSAGMLQRWLGALATSGVTAEDWKASFGPELGIVAEWAANSRIPTLLATLPVRELGKARQIVHGLTIGNGTEDTQWAMTEKAGVQYFIQAPSSPMVPVAATIAISDQLLVAGSDRSAVEQAITRSPPRADTLADSQLFTAGERLVPQAKSAFVYIDIARLYTRLDAAIRPMLVLAATFVPSIAETVDLTKLPPAEVVTKHLTPFVLSQTYETDGYVTESIGPVSIYHAGVGIAIAGGFTKNWYAASPTPSTVPDDAADARASVPTSEASATPTTEPQ